MKLREVKRIKKEEKKKGGTYTNKHTKPKRKEKGETEEQ